MKCILHIGTEKTATTSLQKTLSRNRKELAARGIWYPSSLGPYWHRYLSVYAMETSRADDAFSSLGINTAVEHDDFRIKIEAAFNEESEKYEDCEFCIISSEHLHSRLIKIEEILRVRSFLQGFSDITIFLHVRPQIELLTSLASTLARGNTIINSSFFASTDLCGHYFDYHAITEKWACVFPKSKIIVVPFSKIKDIRLAFKDETGLEWGDLEALPHENSALDIEVIALLNAVKAGGAAVAPFGGVLDELPIRSKIKLARDFAKKLQDQCQHNNARLVEKYPYLTIADLTPNYDMYDEVGNMSVLDSPCPFPHAVADFFERSRSIFKNNQILTKRLSLLEEQAP